MTLLELKPWVSTEKTFAILNAAGAFVLNVLATIFRKKSDLGGVFLTAGKNLKVILR